MRRTETFRQTHTEILQVAEDLSRLLKAEELQRRAAEARSLLSRLSGKLLIHLQMEDNSLYPNVLNSRNDGVTATLKTFIAEMGGIKETFTKFTGKWTSPETIRANPDEFINETRTILTALSKRIERENHELYPLIDKAA